MDTLIRVNLYNIVRQTYRAGRVAAADLSGYAAQRAHDQGRHRLASEFDRVTRTLDPLDAGRDRLPDENEQPWLPA